MSSCNLLIPKSPYLKALLISIILEVIALLKLLSVNLEAFNVKFPIFAVDLSQDFRHDYVGFLTD